MLSAALGEVRRQIAGSMRRAGLDSPLREADLLLAAVLGLTVTFITAHPDQVLTASAVKKVEAALSERIRRVPLAYITGRTFFNDLEFFLDKNVLVPRPDSEILAEAAVAWLQARMTGDFPVRVLDICAGCGCIGISVAVHLRQTGQEIELKMTEIDPRVIRFTRKNIRHHGLEQTATVEQTDLFPQSGGEYDLIIANPPYIPSADIDSLMPEVSCHEPRLALDGGRDGLDFYRRIIAAAPLWLKPGGVIFMEHGFDQAAALRELLAENGSFLVFPALFDYGGKPRVSGGCLLTGKITNEENR